MARGSIVRRPSGNYAIVYPVGGKQKWETVGPSRRDAERALTARMRELATGAWREPSKLTLAEYAAAWLARRDPGSDPRDGGGRPERRRLATSTFREYRRSLELYILPRLGREPLASLRPADVDELIAQLEAEGRAPGTVRNAIAPLRKLLGDAVRQGIIVSNPAANADLPPAQEFAGKELPQEHTTAIRAALHQLARTDPSLGGPDPLYVHLFDVALATGLRLGELRALRCGDVDRERRLIRVERAYSRQELKRPKTDAGLRAVPLFPTAAAAIEALAARAVSRGRYGPAELIFGTARGTPLQPSNFNRRVWQPALRAAGLADAGYRFHDLRHTCVSRLVAAGADVKLVQEVAGHANPLITLKRYSHLLDARITEAAERFDPAASQVLS